MSNHPEASQYEAYAEELEFHESNRLAPAGEKKVVLVDIDETICFYSGKRQYNLAEPSQENIEKINKLHDEGWHVVYWTARGGSEKSKREGLCYYDFTWKQLLSWGCRFDELSTGTKGKYMKPPYDLVIDDKAKRIEEL
ncbi:MAG: hypothetical protein CMI54_05865 [Parcubacteria group bacterium]|nr:hypothetical protein [Parcubacteria group bacterium]|tara:strand:+ start:13324 stop:13740 length:417 start_codon:yes stop_codon:yes gene_type:complete